MSDAKSPSDLSMDEILATIRRIIAEDEQSSTITASAGTAGAAGTISGGGTGSGGETPAGAAPAASEAKPPAHEDVLELTEALNADGSVRRLAPIGSSSAGTAVPPEATPAAIRAAPEPSPVPRSEPEVAPIPRHEPDAGQTPRGDAEPPPEPQAEPQPARREPAGPSGAAPAPSLEDRLVSEVTSFAAAAALARVAAAPRGRQEMPLVGEQPLDEIVRELLRPLLKTWLDENLPQIVERLVEAEISRIGRSTGS